MTFLGRVRHNGEVVGEKMCDGVLVGDIVGCGIMEDSFRRRQIFFTLNGMFLGFISPTLEVYRSLLVAPCVSGDGSFSFRTNLTGPFLWLGKEYKFPKPSDEEGLIATLPVEILQVILRRSANFPAAAALSLAQVCNSWRDIADSNDIWKRFYLKKWQSQNPSLNARNWKKLYRNRHRLDESATTGPAYAEGTEGRAVHAIENCGFDFGCPMRWDDLPRNESDSLNYKVRHCNHCKMDVHLVETKAEVTKMVALGRCVSLVEPDLASLLRGILFTGRIVGPQFEEDGGSDDDAWD